MAEIRLICVGKFREKHYIAAFEEYKKRLAAAMQDFFAAAGRPVGPDERHRKQDEKGGAGGARDR